MLPLGLLVAAFNPQDLHIPLLVFTLILKMTTLPSFVELMATLGLDPATKAPENPSPSPSPSPSPPSSAESSPRLSIFTTAPSPIRAKSSPALRDSGSSRSRAARYSPYSSGLVSGSHSILRVVLTKPL